MRTVKAENLQAGDMLVSYFLRKDKDYPEPQKIERVIHSPGYVELFFIDRGIVISDNMLVIVEDK